MTQAPLLRPVCRDIWGKQMLLKWFSCEERGKNDEQLEPFYYVTHTWSRHIWQSPQNRQIDRKQKQNKKLDLIEAATPRF